MADGTYMCTGAKSSFSPRISDGREPLTSREQTVLLQLAQGKSNREPAEELDISIHTVDPHGRGAPQEHQTEAWDQLDSRVNAEHGALQGTGQL